MRHPSKQITGAFFCIFSACLWGVTGTVGQFLFQETGITPAWLTAVRMIVSGSVFLCFLLLRNGKQTLSIWRNKQDARDLLLFSAFGMLLMQYSYFLTIERSNAATATVLQYLAPVMIVLYVAVRYRKSPTLPECGAVLCALMGTFLLATHGNIHRLSISISALFWGLLSAVALAFYTAFPHRLLQKYGTIPLIAWGMLLGGIFLSFLTPIWQINGTFDAFSIACLLFTIFFGAMLPYLTFLYGVKHIGPTKSSLLASVEPLSSTVVSVLWLHIHLEPLDYIGFALIVTTVFLLSVKLPAQKSSKIRAAK